MPLFSHLGLEMRSSSGFYWGSSPIFLGSRLKASLSEPHSWHSFCPASVGPLASPSSHRPRPRVTRLTPQEPAFSGAGAALGQLSSAASRAPQRHPASGSEGGFSQSWETPAWHSHLSGTGSDSSARQLRDSGVFVALSRFIKLKKKNERGN